MDDGWASGCRRRVGLWLDSTFLVFLSDGWFCVMRCVWALVERQWEAWMGVVFPCSSLRLADQKGYMLLGDCFFSPQGCDVDVGCTVCLPCFLQRERVNLKELRGEIVAGDPLTVGTRGARS